MQPEGLELAAMEAFSERFPYALVLLDESFDVTWVSPGFERLLGHCAESVLGTSVLELVHPADLETLMPMASEMVAEAAVIAENPSASATVELPLRVLDAQGRWAPMTLTGRLMNDDGWLLICLRLAADRHAFEAVLTSLVGDVDLDGPAAKLVELIRAQFEVDRAWLVHDVFGEIEVIRDADAVELDPDEVGTDAVDAEVGIGSLGDYMQRVRRGGLRSEPWVIGCRWVAPVLSGTGEALLGLLVLPSRGRVPNPFDRHVLARTTELAAVVIARAVGDRQLHLAATTDPLTGLLNRREIESLLARVALRPGGLPATLLYVDIDDFKAINDDLGHAAGDAVLEEVAARIASVVRGDDAVGRTGGDEFSVLCPGLPVDRAPELVERLRGALDDPIEVGDRLLPVSISIGIAGAADEDELADLAHRADERMYRDKRSRG